jgi:hypothetical protein
MQLLFLFKMFRFRKMMSLFETKNFQDFIKGLFKTRLQRIIQNKQMNTNQTVDNNMILLQIKIMYIFRVLRLIIIILILSYFLGTLWLLISKLLTNDKDDPEEKTFYNVYELRDKSNFTQLTIVVYFAFTTLSTVGFGDFHPKSEIERIITTFILLCGVACFSYIMG